MALLGIPHTQENTEKQNFRDIYALEKPSKGYGLGGFSAIVTALLEKTSDAQGGGLEGQKMSPLEQSMLEKSLSKAGDVYNENAYSIHVYPTILSPALMP